MYCYCVRYYLLSTVGELFTVDCSRAILTTHSMMDNDMWLVESMDNGSKRLCSPGGTSSGYCSSDEVMVSATTNNTFKRKSDLSEQLLVDPPLSSTVGRLPAVKDDSSTVEKTNATFDGFADSMWEPLSTTMVDDSRTNTAPIPQRRVYRGLITKQLAPSRKLSAASDSSESELGQTISVWNRHVASELGNPFAQTVDDYRTSYKGSKIHSSGMSVDVSVSTKGERSSSKTPTVIIRPVARMRGGAPIVSCSTVLRRSATVPSKMPLVAGQGVVSQCSTSRSDHQYSHQPVLHAESTPSIHEALRDHMYALKVPPPTPVHSSCVDLSKASRMRKSYGHSESAGNRSGMSILEAFLRSTTPCFDANRGSTAIAAEELRKMNVSGSSSRPSVKVHIGDDYSDLTQTASPTPSLLKQLLIGDGNSLNLERSESSDSDSHSPGMAVDSVLTDGFGLDANLQLDDPLSNGIGLLEDNCSNDARKVATENGTLVSKFR